jgi:hypothetical protein
MGNGERGAAVRRSFACRTGALRLLDAIGRSDGTRASVVEEPFMTRVRNGIIGNFRFDE